MWPTWGSPESCRPKMGPTAPWTLLPGHFTRASKGRHSIMQRHIKCLILIAVFCGSITHCHFFHTIYCFRGASKQGKGIHKQSIIIRSVIHLTEDIQIRLHNWRWSLTNAIQSKQLLGIYKHSHPDRKMSWYISLIFDVYLSSLKTSDPRPFYQVSSGMGFSFSNSFSRSLILFSSPFPCRHRLAHMFSVPFLFA